MTDPRVVLVGKPGCHLCEEARVIVARACADAGVDWIERSTEDDPELADAYWEHIPVILIDGEIHSRWFVDPVALASALSNR